MNDFDKFMEERSKIPIPSGDVAWVKLLAKELALGVNRQLWSSEFMIYFFEDGEAHVEDETIKSFFGSRWSDYDLSHVSSVLLRQGFLIRKDSSDWLTPTDKAFSLLEETQPYNIFISYRRLDSSALALLVLTRLKEHSLVPFLDMALEAGGNWHADLEERIKACDYFIILLGKDTLTSEMTVKEIQWALEYQKPIIPLWHSGFGSDDDMWQGISYTVADAIQQINAIRVTDESASGYNSAIVELLNRFGVTP